MGDRLIGKAQSDLRRAWRSPGGRAGLISAGALLSAGTLAGVLADEDLRDFALAKIAGATFPIPGVNGLKMRIDPRRGSFQVQVTYDFAPLLSGLW